jgi:hypothetical protein
LDSIRDTGRLPEGDALDKAMTAFNEQFDTGEQTAATPSSARAADKSADTAAAATGAEAGS